MKCEGYILSHDYKRADDAELRAHAQKIKEEISLNRTDL